MKISDLCQGTIHRPRPYTLVLQLRRNLLKVNLKKMVKSSTLKIGTRNFSDHKNLFRIRSQRANKRESIINHKRHLFSTRHRSIQHSADSIIITSEKPCHHHVAKSKLKTLRKNAPLSEEDFSRFAYQLDLECNSFKIVAETTQHIRKLLSVEVDPPIEKVIRSGAVPFLMQLLDTTDIEKYFIVKGLQRSNVKTSPRGGITKSQLFRLQINACWAITNIVSGTSENVQYVVELGCVPLLVQLLSSEDDALNDQAVWAIGNIAGDSVVLRDYVLELGTMQQIVKLMQGKGFILTLQRNGKFC